jgi:hypothetical protein
MAYDASTNTTVLVAGMDLSGGSPVDTWTWDGAVWTRQRPATVPPETVAGAMAYDPSTRTVVLFNAWGQTWLWNGAAKTWTRQFPKTAPAGRQWPSMAYDPLTKNVVLFGGWLSSTFDDTWVWSGVQKTWTVVLFGGYGPYEALSDPTCETWGCFAIWAIFNDTWTLGAL